MTSKRSKSKIGMVFSGAYLLLIFVAIIEIMVSEPDAMSGIAMMFLALPSILLFYFLPDSALPVVGLALYVFCILLNMAILYVFGAALSVAVRWISVQIERQNESASKTR